VCFAHLTVEADDLSSAQPVPAVLNSLTDRIFLTYNSLVCFSPLTVISRCYLTPVS
jgi:hypothetical protein